ncbi:hypothetical protein PsYK624_025850 [Phanerochaete sordida]|uniref:Uncharacterized protein n=1 Tax=Phanerochaete sordida TaxID=48140 RepID=A0A9P3G2J9_9APHY|nr:hypothetical protein PsYK624_025850 [Phanerochaete sordida]
MAALNRLRLIFEASEALHFPRCMWRRALEPLPSQTRAPTFALSLASLHKNLAQAREVGIDPRLDGPTVQQAPPRIEAAVSALLRPLQNLQRLDVRGVSFKTVTQFLRIVRAAPQLTSIYLEQVSILQASAHLHWPATAVLSNLNRFSMFYCSIPVRSLPIFLSLAFRGRPDVASLRNVQRSGDTPLHRDDINALVSIAEAVVGMYNIVASDENDGHCSVSLREPPTETSVGQMLSVELAECSVELYMKRTEAGRPKTPALTSISVTIHARKDRSAVETASLLAFLDMRLHEMSGDAQPRLRFTCFIDIEGELSGPIFAQLSDIMPRLSAEDRVQFEEDDVDLIQIQNAGETDLSAVNQEQTSWGNEK